MALGFTPVSLTNLSFRQDGFSLGRLTLSQTGGSAQFGNYLTVTGGELAVNDFAVQYGLTPTVTGNIQFNATQLVLFPSGGDVSAVLTQPQGVFQFTGGLLGALTITIPTLSLRVGDAFNIVANNAVLTPGSATLATIPTATVRAREVDGMGPVEITNFVLRRDGFDLGSLTLPCLTETASIGNYLTLVRPILAIENFAFHYFVVGSTAQGTVRLNAQDVILFGNSPTVQCRMGTVSGTYDFFLLNTSLVGVLGFTVGDFSLRVSDAVKIEAQNVQFTPRNPTIAVIGTATVTSPKFSGLAGATLANFELRQTGFTLGSLDLAVAAGQTAKISDYFSLDRLVVSVRNFSLDYGLVSVSINGSVSVTAERAVLFPNNFKGINATITSFSGGFSFGNTVELFLTAETFSLKVDKVIELTASSVVFNTDREVFASLGQLDAIIPALNLTGRVTGLQVRQDGRFTATSFVLSQGGAPTTYTLAKLLPVSLDAVTVVFLGDTNRNGVQDPGEVFDLNEYDLTVTGSFDFSKLGNLPFTPVVRLGAPGAQTTYNSSAQPFAFTLRYTGGWWEVWNLGPIELGLQDFSIGNTVQIEGSVYLGAYVDGVWSGPIHGQASLRTAREVTAVTANATAALVGTLNEAGNELTLDGAMTAGFKVGAYAEFSEVQLALQLVFRRTDQPFTLSLHHVGFSGTAGLVRVQVQTYCRFEASQVAFNFNPNPGQNMLAIGRGVALLNAGDISIAGEVRNIGLNDQGRLIGFPDMEVNLVGGSDDGLTLGRKIRWPAWLPIRVTLLRLHWPDFNANPGDFRAIVSGEISVDALLGTTIIASGFVDQLVIDTGLWAEGKLPLVDLSGFGLNIGGNIASNRIEGGFFGALLKLDAQGRPIDDYDTATPVAERIFYGGITGTIMIARQWGFGIRLGVSQYGPLQGYFELALPLTEPYTGITLHQLRGGITFGVTLPSPATPQELASASFAPLNAISLPLWKQMLRQSVAVQVANLQNITTGRWEDVNLGFRVDGGLSLFDAYLTERLFTLDANFILSSDGALWLGGVMNVAKTEDHAAFRFQMWLFMDFRRFAQHETDMLFLLKMNSKFDLLGILKGLDNPWPFVELYGTMRLEFPTPVDPANPPPAGTFQEFKMAIQGHAAFPIRKAMDAPKLTIDGLIKLHIDNTPTTPFDLEFSGRLNFAGWTVVNVDIAGVAGKLHVGFDANEVPFMYGATLFQPGQTFLASVGLDTSDCTLGLRINTTDQPVTIQLTVPGHAASTVVAGPDSFAFTAEGALYANLFGLKWFTIWGQASFEITNTGFDVYVAGDLILGTRSSSFLTFGFTGFFAVTNDGFGGKAEVSLKTDFPEFMGVQLQGSHLVEFNTTLRDLDFTMPATVLPAGGSREVHLARGPPGSDVAGPYLLVRSLGVLAVGDSIALRGRFNFLASIDYIEAQVDAEVGVGIGEGVVLGFEVHQQFRIDLPGIVDALPITLTVDRANDYGFRLDAVFRLEINTTGRAAVARGVNLEAGRYARVYAAGNLIIGTFTLRGTFQFRVELTRIVITADALLSVTDGALTLFEFLARGGLQINLGGIVGVIDLTLTSDVPAALGFRFNANFRLEVNQIGEAVTLGDITLEAGRYWRVAAQGQMLLGPVTLVGRFLASAGVASITLTADAEVALDLGESVKLLRFRVGGGFQVSLLGLAGAINLQLLDDVPGSLGFTLTGTYQLQVNTTGRQEEIGGVIAEILLEVGEACQAQQPVIRMVDARQCYFTANLEAQAGTDLRVGQPVSLELEVGSAVVALKGAIRYVAPIVDPGSGLLKVKAVFENRDGRVRPGVTGRMRVD